MKSIISHNTHIYIKELYHDIGPLLHKCSPEIVKTINSIASPRRQREIVTSHLMTKEIFGEGVTIEHDASGAPIIVGIEGYISISHSATEIVIAYNRETPIGIDIENWRDQLIKIKSRFLSQKEMTIYSTPQLLLQAWTLKEALYKVAMSPGLSFADDIMLPIDSDSHVAKVNTDNGFRDFGIKIIEASQSHCISLAFPLI